MGDKKKPLPTDLPIHVFSSAIDFEQFLEQEHKTNQNGIYVKFAKKSSGIPSITPAEAVEVALCFGWIDGRANSIDDSWWMARYTPRRAKSIWSKKNVNTVTRLLSAGTEVEDEETDRAATMMTDSGRITKKLSTHSGKMRPSGIAAVEAAKKDGRWDRAYAGPATIVVPDDFKLALENEPYAQAFFDLFSKRDRYSVLWRIETASPKARASKIQALVQMLAAGRKTADIAGGAEGVKTKGVVKSGRVGKARRKVTVEMAENPTVVLDNATSVSKVRVKASTASHTGKTSPAPPRRAGLRSRS